MQVIYPYPLWWQLEHKGGKLVFTAGPANTSHAYSIRCARDTAPTPIVIIEALIAYPRHG